MRQRVLLLNTILSDLLGVESDRLHQRFGQDVCLVGCPEAISSQDHHRNLEVTRVNAVYIPKHAFDRTTKAHLESLFARSVGSTPHYAYAPAEDAQSALLFITDGPDGLVYDRIDT